MPLLISFALALVALSFLCSLLEAVILSVQPAYVAIRVKQNKRSGLLLHHQKKNIDKAIGAILILNSFAQVGGASILGSQIHERYNDFALSIFSVAFTIITLIFAEVLPKSLGARNWKKLAPSSSYIIQFMIFFLYPLVWAVERFASFFGSSTTSRMTREEIIMMIEIGTAEGAIRQKEGALLRNLLMMENIYVSDIMTPRSVIFALEEEATVEQVGLKYKPIRFSRIPVYTDNLDHIIGMTHRYKIMDALSHDQDKLKINEILAPIKRVPETMTVSSVVDFFIKNKTHIALAVDENNVLTGLISLEDAVETLLGAEIVDELDSVADLRQYALDQWQQRRSKTRN